MALLKLRQAAQACGISYQTLWAAVRSRAVPSIRITDRGNYLVDTEDVRAWLEEHRVAAVDGRLTHVRKARPRPVPAPEPVVSAAEVFNPVAALMPPERERRFS